MKKTVAIMLSLMLVIFGNAFANHSDEISVTINGNVYTCTNQSQIPSQAATLIPGTYKPDTGRFYEQYLTPVRDPSGKTGYHLKVMSNYNVNYELECDAYGTCKTKSGDVRLTVLNATTYSYVEGNNSGIFKFWQ